MVMTLWWGKGRQRGSCKLTQHVTLHIFYHALIFPRLLNRQAEIIVNMAPECLVRDPFVDVH
jgi:hypothetical protein